MVPNLNDCPHTERLVHLVLENLFYAKGNADKLAEIAKRLDISTESAIAVVIVDTITEEFTVTPRE